MTQCLQRSYISTTKLQYSLQNRWVKNWNFEAAAVQAVGIWYSIDYPVILNTSIILTQSPPPSDIQHLRAKNENILNYLDESSCLLQHPSKSKKEKKCNPSGAFIFYQILQMLCRQMHQVKYYHEPLSY